MHPLNRIVALSAELVKGGVQIEINVRALTTGSVAVALRYPGQPGPELYYTQGDLDDALVAAYAALQDVALKRRVRPTFGGRRASRGRVARDRDPSGRGGLMDPEGTHTRVKYQRALELGCHQTQKLIELLSVQALRAARADDLEEALRRGAESGETKEIRAWCRVVLGKEA